MKHHLTALRYFRSCVSRRGVRIATFLLVFLAQYLSRLFSVYHMPLPSEGCSTNPAYESAPLGDWSASDPKDPEQKPSTRYTGKSYDPLTLAYDSLLYQSLFYDPTPGAGTGDEGVGHPKNTPFTGMGDDGTTHTGPTPCTGDEPITVSKLQQLVHVHAKYLCIFLGLWAPGYFCSRKSACALQWSIASALVSCCFACYLTCILVYRANFGNEDTPLALSMHMGMQLLNSYSAFIRVTPEIHTFQWMSLEPVTALLQACVLLYTILTPYEPLHLFFNTVISLILLEGQRLILYFPITTMPILLFDAASD